MPDDAPAFPADVIPIQYHFNMLSDGARMDGFHRAVQLAVRPGMKVVDLGGGTGVLSWFAARQGAERVWCVELLPEMATAARAALDDNEDGDRVTVVNTNALEFLPPEPVDVVLCEMLHVGLLREKQLEVIDSFKRRYLARFGGPLPVFMPEAVVMAVQPLQQRYDFHGYHAPIVQFQDTGVAYPGTVELAQPAVYGVLDFAEPVDSLIAWSGSFLVEASGTLNALRFVTKNVLSIVQERGATIDWLNHYMTLPLAKELDVVRGDVIDVTFQYRAGGSIPSLQAAIRATLASESACESAEEAAAVSVRTVEFA